MAISRSLELPVPRLGYQDPAEGPDLPPIWPPEVKRAAVPHNKARKGNRNKGGR